MQVGDRFTKYISDIRVSRGGRVTNDRNVIVIGDYVEVERRRRRSVVLLGLLLMVGDEKVCKGRLLPLCWEVILTTFENQIRVREAKPTLKCSRGVSLLDVVRV